MFTLRNSSLQALNTFGIDVDAKEINLLCSEQDVKNYLTKNTNPQILGSGSNILFTKNIDRPIIKSVMQGIEAVREYDQYIDVRVEAGVVWHEFVLWCLEQGYGGIENLSLIPGTVGAAPVQNIGAYGVELDQVLVNVECYELVSAQKIIFSNEDCKFRYRDSLFKNERKDEYFISAVVFRLTTKDHVINQSYSPLSELLAKKNISTPNINDISKAVIDIRQSKLPDPVLIGNAGSFFKNPILPNSQIEELRDLYPDLKTYPVDDQNLKLPAAWLIDKCGWKGKRVGDAGVHNKHALVIVNHNAAKGSELLKLSQDIQSSVLEKFNIQLKPEVNIL